ncbi:hypothetical protein ABMY20_09935 [Tenacibaculum sp. SSH1-16]|uniref:hypothetical protein n=1 Tax=Tenacibaculum sp. SSH1-16 TaxID=3136667 RepID=UPI0032C45E14
MIVTKINRIFKIGGKLFLVIILFFFVAISPFSFNRYKNFKKRVDYIDDYIKIKVKVDSVKYDISTTIREGEVQEIYYHFKGFADMVRVDEDAKDGYYKHFLNSKQDSIYIWYNPNADDLYTTKDSKPLSLKHQKYLMYRDLCFLILGVILTLWFIYIMFIEKKENK